MSQLVLIILVSTLITVAMIVVVMVVLFNISTQNTSSANPTCPEQKPCPTCPEQQRPVFYIKANKGCHVVYGGNDYNVTNARDCAKICNIHSDCAAFHYSTDSNVCRLGNSELSDDFLNRECNELNVQTYVKI